MRDERVGIMHPRDAVHPLHTNARRLLHPVPEPDHADAVRGMGPDDTVRMAVCRRLRGEHEGVRGVGRVLLRADGGRRMELVDARLTSIKSIPTPSEQA